MARCWPAAGREAAPGGSRLTPGAGLSPVGGSGGEFLSTVTPRPELLGGLFALELSAQREDGLPGVAKSGLLWTHFVDPFLKPLALPTGS